MNRWTLVALLLSLACTDKRASNDTSHTTVERIISSTPAGWSDSAHAWHLVLERTIQPSVNSPDALNAPFQILLTADGGVIVMDRKPAVIRYFRADGTVRQIGRLGEGPGEYRQPIGALVGDTIVVLDWTLRRAMIMRLNGDLIRTFPVNHDAVVGPPMTIQKGGIFRVTVMRRSEKDFLSQWVRTTPEGATLDTVIPPILAPEGVWSYSPDQYSRMSTEIPMSASTQYAFLPDGNIVYGRTDRDEFIVTSNGRDTVRVFGRSGAAPVPITTAERENLFKMAVSGDTAIQKVAKLSDIPTIRPLWSSLYVDGLGNIWVSRDINYLKSSLVQWDLYSPAGAWLGQVQAPFRPEWSKLAISNDRMALLGEDDNGNQQVKVYRIVR